MDSILERCPRCGGHVTRETWLPKTRELRRPQATFGTVVSLPSVPLWTQGFWTSQRLDQVAHYACQRCLLSIAVLAR